MMKVKDIIEKLSLNAFTGQIGQDREVCSGYSSDLLSDVMGNAKEGDAWVTLQTHKNIMAVASLKDLACVILVQGLKPDEDMLETAKNEQIPVLGTDLKTFELVGKLYNELNES